MTLDVLRHALVVFWDFDGVIKESVDVKTWAFGELFLKFGDDVAARVRAHHESHSGVTRYEKVPIYLDWAGEAPTEDRVREYCDRFASLVRQRVIDAPWVPGVREYLAARHEDQRFVLVTATPQNEMEHILRALKIAACFREVHGAPTPKTGAIGDVLRRWALRVEDAVMVGDADSDHCAAAQHGVAFVLRRTPLNRALQDAHRGASFDGLVTDLQVPEALDNDLCVDDRPQG